MSKIIFLMLMLPLIMAGQVTDLNYHNGDSISFSYSKNIYQKIAVDTIKRIYNDRHKLYLEEGPNMFPNPNLTFRKWEDLTIVSIPYFRLTRQANRSYTCESNIEDFIAFREHNKYQCAKLIHKKIVLAEALIPNIDYEMERISNPGEYIEGNQKDYKVMLLRFGASGSEFGGERYYDKEKDIMDKRSDNFFFGIYGLNVLFEIDSKTGLLYANLMYEQVERYLANDYLRKYVGEVKIRELARGYYEDIDYLGTLMERPCEKTDIISKKVIIRVNRID